MNQHEIYDQPEDEPNPAYDPTDYDQTIYKMNHVEQQIWDICKTLSVLDFKREVERGNLHLYKTKAYNLLDIATDRFVICSHTREFLYHQVANLLSERNISIEAIQHRIKKKDSGIKSLDHFLPITLRCHWNDDGEFEDIIWEVGITAKQFNCHPIIKGLGVSRLTSMAKGELDEYGKYQVLKSPCA